MRIQRRYSRRAIAMLTSGAAIVALALVAVPGMVAANAAGVSQTFAYSSSPQTFTVPAGVTRLDVSLLGGEGGLGGADSTAPLQGGYRGSVSGTLSVTPGEVITIGVGQGGSAGASKLGSAPGGVGGSNPVTGYTGGTGGIAGDQGSSGGGGGGGAATVIQVGTRTVIAGGGGGGGGSGQFAPTAGQPGAADFTARTDVVSTGGQNGISTGAVCTAGIRCDGGASGAGGAGAIGGAPGAVAYGAGTSTEYFGYGGSPGANDASALTSPTAVYQYYAVDGANGSVTISYDQSAPGAPTGVSGAVADGATNLSWLAPLSSGGADITDYVVQYALAGASPSWQTFDDGTSAATSAQVTGLTNGTAYQFQVAAVNSFGQSAFSAASTAVTPSAVPGAPTLTSLTGSDSRISVAFTAATSDAAITSYEYQLDGGDWVSTGTSSPFSIGGLTNGTPYSLVLRAVNSVGAGAASGSLSATPVSTPSAPTITAIATGIGSASVSFSASSAGGSPITGYQYQLGSGSWISTGSSSSPFSITGLANGTSYTVALRAISATGSGASSGPSTFATPGAPSAPTISAISVGDGSLDVNFTAGNSGGLAISGYEYQLTSGGVWTAAPTSSSPLVLSGLANGTPYSVRLRAINAIGTGAASAAVSATPVTTPGPPALLAGSVAGGNQQLDASFTAPISDGGTPITGYEYSTDGGVTWRTRATGTTESPLVITTLSGDGTTTLVNGTTYSVEVRAVNAVGAGTSSGVAEGIARTSPDAPSLTTVDSLPKALRVDFASASNGGSPITSYQYRLNGGTWTNTGSMSTEFTIGALADGTSYAVEVRAVNAVGASSASSPLTATPASQPGRALVGSLTASDRSLSVSVSVTSTGGSPITAWEYTTDAGASWASLSDTSSPITISNLSSDSSKRLTNGVSYPIEVRAVNAVGTGAASDSTLGIPLTTPSAPTVTLTARNGGIGVNFVAGSSGGSNVTGVEYSIDDATWIPVGSLNTSFAIGSLTNGTLYSVRVRLVNGAGNGDASAAQSATPCTVPDAPTAVAVSPDGSVATVSWSAPAYDGGVAVTDYTATAWSAASGGTAVSSCSTNGETCTIGGLTNGTVYYVSVVATNPAGYGDASSPRVAVVPLAKPSAPAISSITPANTFLTVNFSAGSAGSSAITGYQYSLNSGAWVSVTTTASPLVISGLTNGVTYSVVLRAVNQSGPGASSTAVVGTPFGVPDVPDSALITATPGNGSTTVNWIAPDNNGSAISSYGVVVWSASFQGTQVTTCATALLTCTLSGLVNGTTYYVTVDATNAAGTTTRSTPRVAVTPGAPGSVAGLAGTASDGTVALWWAPGSSGVGPITDYTIWYAAVGSSSYTQFADGVSTGTSATVTGLSNGTAYRFLVYPINSFGVGQPSSASAAYTPLAAGTTPTLSTAVSADGGFSATITNPEIGTDYGAVSDYGAATVSGDTVTVVGLDDGQSATVTVTATHFGRRTTQASVDGSALLAGTLPVLGAPVRTSDGYTVEISNYSNGVAY
ncbi:MAG: fibronectin type protein, partial [Glaciihabitans sp.]|nr:fibronectin type protein [Glaciihabitans sp.]